MNTRVMIIGLTVATAAFAQPQDEAAPYEDALENESVIERLESDVADLREEVSAAREDLRRNEQMLRELRQELVRPRMPAAAPAYTPAVRNAILELSSLEQKLISGDVEGVEERLVRAHGALEGTTAAWAIEDAIDALLANDLGDARGYINRAIRHAEESY